MTWHTHYLTEMGRKVGRVIDTLPYHSVLLLIGSTGIELCAKRIAHLKAAWRAEQNRPAQIGTKPYHLVLDVSDVCNLSCPLCVQATDPNGRRRSVMEVSTAVQALTSLQSTLIRVELFNWGEPLLNPDFVEIVRRADSGNIFSRTSTHLSLRNPPDTDTLFDSGLKWIVVSIDGATQKTYEKYRVGGEFDLVLANVKRLVETKRDRSLVFPIIEWQYLVLRHNVDEIERALEFAEDVGVDIFRYGGARGVLANRIRVSSRENYAESIDFLLEGTHPLSEYRKDGEKLHVREREGCRWLWGKLAIHPDGGVSPCWTSWRHKSDFGSIKATPLEHLWHGAAFTAARKAATGTKNVPGSARLCEQCASHEAFVNAPERLDRWPSRSEIQFAADQFTDAGIDVDPDIRDEVEFHCAS